MKPTLFTIAYCVFEQHDPCNVEIGYMVFFLGYVVIIGILIIILQSIHMLMNKFE